MICRPDLRVLLTAGALLSLVSAAAAVPGDDPLAAAEAAVARGDGMAAEVAAGRALKAGAAREEVAALAGEGELLQGDLAAARGWLEPARFSAASRGRGFQALGRLELLEGNLAGAARAFDSALAENERNATLWVDIGRMRYLAGEHRLALDAAARAVASDPGEPRALEFRGQLARDAEGLIAALPWFERALDKAPNDIGLLGEYAATLGEAGRHRDMLRVARRMVEIDPRHPRAYFLQAVLAARAGRDDLARRLMWRTDGAYDEAPAGRLLAGILELRTGNPALAVEQFDALARSQPDNGAAALLLGRALLANDEANEVVARFGATAARADASPYLLTLMGRAYEQLGRRYDAARYLDRAAAPLSPRIEALPVDADGDLTIWRWQRQRDDAVAAVPLLRRMLARGEVGEATRLSASLGQSYPGSADVARLRGDVALMTGDAASALALYERAAVVRRDFALVERMAAAQRMFGRTDAAVRLVADYATQNPRDRAAAALLGRMLADRGNWRRSAAFLAHAALLGGGSGDPRLLADLANAQLAVRDREAAAASARRAYALQRTNGRVAAVLARVMQAGQQSPGEAAVLLAKARQLSHTAALALR